MLSKSVFFVTCLLIANGAMGQTGQLEITAPWARATPGHAENGAAYLTIVSPTADRLTAASSPVAKKVELHTMSMEGGVMRMRLNIQGAGDRWSGGKCRLDKSAAGR
jgi:copper(I)-binding protein